MCARPANPSTSRNLQLPHRRRQRRDLKGSYSRSSACAAQRPRHAPLTIRKWSRVSSEGLPEWLLTTRAFSSIESSCSGRKFTLIHPTRAHRQLQRLTLDHRTQIPTRPQQPPTRMKPPRHRGKAGSNLSEPIRHAGKMLLNANFAQVGADQFSNCVYSSHNTDDGK